MDLKAEPEKNEKKLEELEEKKAAVEVKILLLMATILMILFLFNSHKKFYMSEIIQILQMR